MEDTSFLAAAFTDSAVKANGAMDGPHGTKLTKKPHSLDQPGGARLLLVQQGIFN